ncbi:hypothetical protein URS_2226 [Acinetobacter ursingii]|nr:hypothetical protein URS_2226 [Acinetobacter ursingii]
MFPDSSTMGAFVHGGIRHLEIIVVILNFVINVHGGIRHLENKYLWLHNQYHVHGGIRHLEIFN